MHNALLIYEILDGIINHLAQDISGADAKHTRKAGQRALAALARTCRAFSEPALDALWCRLDSLEPFILCLPAKASYDDDRMPAFDDEEWSIVLRYAPRVQELKLDDELSLKVLQSLWFRTTLLLPNLKGLYWNYDDCTGIILIRLFLSPSLVRLYAWLSDGDHPSVMGFLECYHILCPNLESLEFTYSYHFPHVLTAISRAISRQNLKALLCGSIDEPTLMHISSSRQLERLDADLEDYQPDDLRRLAAYGNPGLPPFENLRTLKLCFQDLSSVIPYLRSLGQPFECVSFKLHIAPTPEVLREFFTALGSTTRQRTLRKISIIMIGWKKHPMSLQAIDFQVLSLLMNFNLHVFNVNLHNPVTLTDDELVHLVQAWPDLERLYLNKCGWDHHSASNIPTLKGLLLVIERCPKLRRLGLCVDARHVPSLSDADSSICNRGVERLSLADSPIQDSATERVAQFLLDHFPVLRLVHRVWDGYQAMWDSVDMLINESRRRAVVGEASSSSPEQSEDESESDSDGDVN